MGGHGRLDTLSSNQMERLVTKFQDEWEARLDKLIANQTEILARESQEEREARLDRMQECKSKAKIGNRV